MSSGLPLYAFCNDHQHENRGTPAMSAASTSAEVKATAAGIVERGDLQQRVIPESRRADGSVRKERKVRPGFTPVEDVQRYRPARAREAEEARKKGVPGSASSVASATNSASSSRASSIPVPPQLEKQDFGRMSWRSNTTRTSTASSLSDAGAQPRGKFAPLEAPKTAIRDRPSGASSVGKSEAPSSAGKPWQNSRLRKSLPLKQDEKAAVPDAWDQEDAKEDSRAGDREGKETTRKKHLDTAADDLAAELHSLSINSNKAAQDG
ncbi:uncharacterized protein UTRI_05779 [Ustilago trichophora]|uniref:WIBG Mago-binding domain-containing protein n=1 Tax=Ustilago trichophora TaxID=86804 RepID=A0A5C3EJT2_9BASI|nr:uncharacterized protein UTRI_05779 [Ustilago trichophora]